MTDRDRNIGPLLAEKLDDVRRRTVARIAELESLLARIEDFEHEQAAELSGRADFRTTDPRTRRGP